MLLCIDIGNTNIKYAVFNGDNLVGSYRASSITARTADEYGVTLINLLRNSNIETSDITDIIISSVIPNLNYTISHMCEYFFKVEPIMVNSTIKSPIKINVDNNREVGADIIVNSVAAFTKYNTGKPMIVIDFGTATTFDIITGDGQLIGVVIAPGLKSSLEGLVSKTAQLPMIELVAPSTNIPKNTKESMQAGIIFGFAGLVENIVKKIKDSLGVSEIDVNVTGGLSKMIVSEVSCITRIDRKLTLEGLKILYDYNKR